MRKKILGVLFFFSLLILSVSSTMPQAFAHGSGQPFVKINESYARNNPLTTYFAYPSIFKSGADLAATTGYLVNESISFSVDEEALSETYYFDPKSEEVREYRWEFGDKTSPAEGVSVSHAYSKPGTYIATLSFHTPSLNKDFQTIDTIEFMIIPNKGYAPPKAQIRLNGKQIKNADKDIIEVRANQKVTFDAGGSTGKIKSYYWVLGDDTQKKEKSFAYAYKDDYYLLYPMLRVTDENNITSDAFVILDFPEQQKKQSFFENFFSWLTSLFKK